MVLRGVRTEDATFESVLSSSLVSVSFILIESFRCKSIALTLVGLSTGALCACLNSAVFGVLVTENVRILVRGTGDLGL